MKLIYCIFAIGCAALVSGCSVPSAHNDGLGHDHSHHAHHDENEEEAHHDSEIHLSEADALQFGVETSVVDFVPFSGSIKVSGQLFAAAGSQAAVTAQSAGVIHFDPAFTPGREVAKGARLASISARGMAGGDAVESARIAYQAAKRELDRVTPLHADGIVSTSAYNAALQAHDAAKAAYTGGASGSVVKAPIAGVLSQVAVTDGQYVEAGTEIAVVTDGGRLTLRVDLPQDMASVIPSVVSARVCGAGQSEAVNLSELNGRKEGSRCVVGDGVAPSGYVPLYFTFDNPGTLQPGGYVEVYLLTGVRDNVLAVPRSALTEQEGNYFVYVKVHDDAYEKRLVSIGDTDGASVEIRSGIAAGDRVVIRGATLVKLAASSGKVPEGHSHNH